MSDFESALRAAVGAWPSAAEPDWDDVLRRAGISGPRTRAIGALRVAALAAGFGIVAVLLTVPAFGIGERLKDLVAGSKRPGLTLRATLLGPDGARVGSFSIRTSRIFVTVRRHGRAVPRVSPPRLRIPDGIPVTWRLELEGSDQATSVRIVRTRAGTGKRLVAVVCDPCSGRTSGRLRLTRSAFDSLVRGRSSVLVSTRTGRASGQIRFESLRR